MNTNYITIGLMSLSASCQRKIFRFQDSGCKPKHKGQGHLSPKRNGSPVFAQSADSTQGLGKSGLLRPEASFEPPSECSSSPFSDIGWGCGK